MKRFIKSVLWILYFTVYTAIFAYIAFVICIFFKLWILEGLFGMPVPKEASCTYGENIGIIKDIDDKHNTFGHYFDTFKSYGRIYFANEEFGGIITKNTRIYKKTKDKYILRNVNALKVGQQVEIKTQFLAHGFMGILEIVILE